MTEAKQQLGFALEAALHLKPALQLNFIHLAQNAFVQGLHAGLLVAAGAAAVVIIPVLVFLPSRPRPQDVERQAAEFGRDHPGVPAAAAAGGDGAAAPVPVPDGNGGQPAPSPARSR